MGFRLRLKRDEQNQPNVSILAGQDKIFTVEGKVGLSKFGLDAEVNSQRKNFRQKSAKDESANFEFFDHIF